MRAERYGGAGDWEIIFTVWVKDAGAIEQAAHTRLSQYCVARDYWKDGFRQTGIELLECSFTEAKRALMAAAGSYHASYVRARSLVTFELTSVAGHQPSDQHISYHNEVIYQQRARQR